MRGQRAGPFRCAACRVLLGTVHGRTELEMTTWIVALERILGGWSLRCGCGRANAWYGKIRG